MTLYDVGVLRFDLIRVAVLPRRTNSTDSDDPGRRPPRRLLPHRLCMLPPGSRIPNMHRSREERSGESPAMSSRDSALPSHARPLPSTVRMLPRPDDSRPGRPTDDAGKALKPDAARALFAADSGAVFSPEGDDPHRPARGRVDALLLAAPTDRKRALANARFLGECCMSGVPTAAAADAAGQAHERYEKWWIRQCHRTSDESTSSGDAAGEARPGKRPRTPGMLTASDDAPESLGLRRLELSPPPRMVLPDSVQTARQEMLAELRRTGGVTTTARFLECVETLQRWYATRIDARPFEYGLDGSWKCLNRPSFSECLGRNDEGDYMYTLGRIAFDVFRPTDLVCSIKGVYNLIKPVQEYNLESGRPRYVPHRLSSEVDASAIRIYDTISLIQIEAGQTRRGTSAQGASADDYIIHRPIQARMTNHGFLLPDLKVRHRYTVQFTGGSLRLRDPNDLSTWREVFDPDMAPPYKMRELAHMLASNIFLGTATQAMQEDGSLRYSFKKPIGGHGQTFIDVLYNDDNFRVVRGHHGSYFCFSRYLPVDA